MRYHVRLPRKVLNAGPRAVAQLLQDHGPLRAPTPVHIVVLLVEENDVKKVAAPGPCVLLRGIGSVVALPPMPPWPQDGDVHVRVAQKALQRIKEYPIHSHKVVICGRQHQHLELARGVQRGVQAPGCKAGLPGLCLLPNLLVHLHRVQPPARARLVLASLVPFHQSRQQRGRVGGHAPPLHQAVNGARHAEPRIRVSQRVDRGGSVQMGGTAGAGRGKGSAPAPQPGREAQVQVHHTRQRHCGREEAAQGKEEVEGLDAPARRRGRGRHQVGSPQLKG